MKKVKETKSRKKEFNKGEVFTRIMAGILLVLMVGGVCASLIFALI